ncbi:MAG TPA: metal-dependent hydrolase, partial [Sphingomicrobium sp.]|nr:metal-dependent hydrolase [Sphingomicrobium sp.]
MDNLTHSLVGAVLGRMGLKTLSPRAMPALIIAANLPDIDSFVAGAIGCQPIAAHRGFTHGIGGLVTMPFLAVAIIWMWEKLRPGKEGPLRLGGLLLACFLGVLSHPLLDLMNTYGTRVLEPFSHRWFYADTLFIADPWIWLMLILGLELSWRSERLGSDWRRPAAWAFTAMLLYIGLNNAISVRAAQLTRPLVDRVAPARMIVAGEVPLEFWKRKMIWRSDDVGGSGTYNLLDGLNHLRLDPVIVPLRLDDPRLAKAAASDRHVRAFLFWSRMPMVVVEGKNAYLTDQRFFEAGRASSSNFLIRLDKPRS